MIEPELDATTDEILATIAREVPDYARPLEGSFGRGRADRRDRGAAAVRRADPKPVGRARARARGLRGARRRRAARGPHARRAAVRLSRRARGSRGGGWLPPPGARASTRTCSACSPSRSSPTSRSCRPTRSRATPRRAARVEGERRRRRRELVTVLVRDPPAERGRRASRRRGGGLAHYRARQPRSPAARTSSTGSPRDCRQTRSPRALDGIGCAIVPDPDGPGRRQETELAVESGEARAPRWARPRRSASSACSWSLARATLRAVEAGAIEARGLVRADDVAHRAAAVRERRARGADRQRRLAPLDELTPKARTAHGGDRARVRPARRATPLPWRVRSACIHRRPATACARLRELLGDALDDPDARFELELALRARL